VVSKEGDLYMIAVNVWQAYSDISVETALIFESLEFL